VPFLNFAPLQNAVGSVQQSARNYDRTMGGLKSNGKALSPEKKKALNAILLRMERALTSRAGLPRRPWFTHQIYAPGFYTGYGVKTLPAVREAIEQRNWPEANAQIVVVAQTLERFAGEIERATAILSEATN